MFYTNINKNNESTKQKSNKKRIKLSKEKYLRNINKKKINQWKTINNTIIYPTIFDTNYNVNNNSNSF